VEANKTDKNPSFQSELSQIFSGPFLKKFNMNVFGGLGFTTLLMFYSKPDQAYSLYQWMDTPLFWILLILGFIYTNSMISEVRNISFRQMYYRLPIVILMFLAIYFLGPS
jgi:hypothetical protein